MIIIDDYLKLADNYYEPSNAPSEWPTGVVAMQTQDAPIFFQKYGNSNKKYIIISYNSDYGICLQSKNFPNEDLPKAVYFKKWQAYTAPRNGYTAVVLGPMCVPENCNPFHKYSIKVYAHTAATFDEIPDNVVRWYSTNVAVAHDKIRAMPFGINKTIAEIIDKFKGRSKTNLCYANFRNHTAERIQLVNWLVTQPWCKTIVKSVPEEQYLTDLSESLFTIAPEGNGYDCYRTYEAIHLNTWPILSSTDFSKNLHLDLPILHVRNYYELTKENLEDIYKQISQIKYDRETLKLSFWQAAIADDKKLLV